MKSRVTTFIAAAVVLCQILPRLHADERRSAAELLPASTVVYAEVPDPPKLLAMVFDHPLREKIEALAPWKTATQTQEYRNFLTGRKVVESHVGMEWREALDTLTAGGIYAGLDAETHGVAILVRGTDAAAMELLWSKLVELAKMDKNPDAIKQSDYRGITAYEADKSRFAVVEDWLLVTNSSELGKTVLDRFLDGLGPSLADDKQFQEASAARGENRTAWAFANVEAVRNSGAAKKLFAGDADNPAVELLVGGILSTLQHTPFVTAELTASEYDLGLSVRMPHRHNWVPEERAYFFGPDGSGRGPVMPASNDTLFTLSTYRDVSEMWLRAGDLFDERIVDGFAEADANLTTLFAGKDFGEDILGSLTPEIGFIATKQDFTDVLPQPAIKLPSFALVLGLQEPESMTRELRRTFQSMVGFFNVLGAMEGRPQLEMSMEQLGDGAELVTSAYIAEPDEADSTHADIIFNFSPSVGFAGERFVVSSSATLARELTAAPAADVAHIDSNTRMMLEAEVLQAVLADNREQLIAQNMLEDGNSREEAEAAIALLLEFVGYFEAASLQLGATDSELEVGLNVRLKVHP